MINGQGTMEETEFGAKRESNDGRGRFDLFPFEAMEALAIWYEDGAKKYSDRNWEKGLSVQDCINRMIRHSLKAGNGWTDEDHLAAVMWNAAAAITMMKRHPECNDHPWHDSVDHMCNSLNAQSGLARHNLNENRRSILLDNVQKLLRQLENPPEKPSV